jgi:virginiamycin B lyase
MKRLASVALLLFLMPLAGVSAEDKKADIREWRVPWESSRPRDPYPDREGRVWFVGQAGDYIASLDPFSGKFRRFELERGTGPHNLIVDGQGMIWYAGNTAAHIGLLNPMDGSIRKYPMPLPAARDPHTLVFGPSGDIWFTVQGGNFVGRLGVKTGEVRLIPVPTKGSRPYGIIGGADGTPWFAEFGSNKLGRINTRAMTVEEFVLPREDARPRRLAHASDGSIWYVDYAQGYIGKFDVRSGKFSEWRVPGGKNARPYGMALDGRDRLWFVETGRLPNRLVGFDPERESFFGITEIPSGGGSVRNMFYDPSTRSIWFGTDAGTIGRASLPE